MEMRFKGTAEEFCKTGKAFASFSPLPPAADRDFYENLPDDLKAGLIRQGEKYLNYSYPAIKAVDYMAFRRTGNRTDYETLYFSRRYALGILVTAECIEYKGRFLDDIINGIFAICEESGWQLPAHNTYIRDTIQFILPDKSRPVLDLFACETGALLAVIHYLLKRELDQMSPTICQRIREELRERIILPYLNEHFWWMGKDDEPMCNWTPWCTQNVLLTAFILSEEELISEDEKKVVFMKAAESCDYFIKDYGEDGCCDEGAQYYRHAGLCLFLAMEVLNQITEDSFQSLFEWPKIGNIASYILNVHVNDKYYFNFADCSPIAGRAGVREYLFGKRTNQPRLSQFAAGDFQISQGLLFTDDINQINLFYRMLAICHYHEIMSLTVPKFIEHTDIYYPSVGLFLIHSDSYSLAVKSGHNGDNHNHNDTGSFTLYKNGKPLFVDIGVESYTAKTFSSRRYEIWTMQSGYHNLPTLNGVDQKDGTDYHASSVEVSLEGSTPSISMELSTAYPLEDISLSYVRCVTLDREKNCVILEDTTDCQDVILNFITYNKPEIKNNFLMIGDAVCHFDGAELLAVETLPITDARLKTAWDHDLYRIRMHLKGKRFIIEIG